MRSPRCKHSAASKANLIIVLTALTLMACGEAADTRPGQPVAHRRAAFKKILLAFEPIGVQLRESGAELRRHILRRIRQIVVNAPGAADDAYRTSDSGDEPENEGQRRRHVGGRHGSGVHVGRHRRRHAGRGRVGIRRRRTRRSGKMIGAEDGAVGIAAALVAQRLAAIAAVCRGWNFRMDLAIHI